MTREETAMDGVEDGIIDKGEGMVKINHFPKKSCSKAKEIFSDIRLKSRIIEAKV